MATRLPLGRGLLAYGEKDAVDEDGAGDRFEDETAPIAAVVTGGRGSDVKISGGCRDPLLLIRTATELKNGPKSHLSDDK